MTVTLADRPGIATVINTDSQRISTVKIAMWGVNKTVEGGIDGRLGTTEHQGSVAAIAICQGQACGARQRQGTVIDIQTDSEGITGVIRVIDADQIAAGEHQAGILVHGRRTRRNNNGCIVDGCQGDCACQGIGIETPGGSAGAAIVKGDAVIPGGVGATAGGIIAIVTEAYRLDNRLYLCGTGAVCQVDGQGGPIAATGAINACGGAVHKQAIAGLITIAELNGD